MAAARVRVGALAGVVMALVAPGVALASVGHRFIGALSEAPVGTALSEPASVATDHASGQVFVGDVGAGVVDVFSSAGVYEAQFGEEGMEAAGIAVDEADGDVYVADRAGNIVLAFASDLHGGYRLLAKWSGAATPGKAFGEVEGVAFDNSSNPPDPAAGDLYVLESGAIGENEEALDSAIDVYKPAANPVGEDEQGQEGTFVRRLEGRALKLEEPNAITLDGATGRVLVADAASGAIYPFTETGTAEEPLKGKGSPYGSFAGREDDEENVEGVAVDEASGDIYVSEAEHQAISQYDSAGEWVGWTKTAAAGAPLAEPRGLAVEGAGELYVADAGSGIVDEFGPGVVVPSVETGRIAKSGLTATTAIVPATVDGEGKTASYYFQYGESEGLEDQSTTHTSGSGSEVVMETIEGLKPGTTYYYRAVAEDEDGVNYGIVRSLETAPAVAGVSTGAAEGIATTSATLAGSLTPKGVESYYYFQWGTTESYGHASPTPPGTDAGSGRQAVAARTELSGLSPNTTYHFRLVATDGVGVTVGADERFTTPGPPRISDETISGVGHAAATLDAKIDPGKLETSYRFEYGETTAYGGEAPAGGGKLAAGEAFTSTAAALTGLKIGTTYHFRVLASNAAGTIYGRDQTFETAPPVPIDETFAAEVSSKEATLHATIDPLGSDTHYYFQYGSAGCAEAPSVCTDTPAAPGEDIGAGSEGIARTVKLTDLTPSTTYHYRVVAANGLGVTEGPERTFTSASEVPLALADGRAWEMVSPPDKHGIPIEPLTREGGLTLASEDGQAITYVADGALSEDAPGNRAPEPQQIISRREEGGWSSEDVAPPNVKAQGLDVRRRARVPVLHARSLAGAGGTVQPQLAR